jgi:leader peptidase (prepilin peptidase)/N-methyltransferase
MIWLTDLFIFLFGLIIGSFLNVVIYRYNTGFSLGGRSQCFSCGKALQWYELVPVFSYLYQRGKCAGCGSKISWQYPLVELVTGLLFLGIWQLDISPFLLPLYLIVWSLLVVIAAYDLRHKIIPDGLVFGFAGVSFVALILEALLPNFRHLELMLVANGILAALVLAGFFWFLWFISKGKWMGFGDAKLSLGVGLLLGLKLGISAIAFAFWIGAIAGVLLILFSKLLPGRVFVTMRSEIPFAPFIIIGTALVFFFQIDVFQLFF